MPRRLHTRIRSVASTLLLLGFAASTQASSTSLVNFQLANSGTTNVPRIDFNVIPPGAVTPPLVGTDSSGQAVTGSPVTLLPNSSGFDANYFSVALGNKPGAQILRFLFGQAQTVDANGNVTFSSILDSSGNPIGGFQPGAKMNFSVSVDAATNNSSPLRLQIVSSVPGLTLNQLPASVPIIPATIPGTSGQGTNSTTQPPQQTQVPEPMSVVVWSGLIGLGLTRARYFRKAA